MLIDTHCHLDAHYFAEGPDAVIERARAAGVGGFVCIGVGGAAAAEHAVGVAQRRADVVATVGIHPHEAGSSSAELFATLTALSGQPKVVAIGEIGLDYHYDHSPRDVQRDVFAKMIGFARERRLPIVVHTREAAADTLEILQREGAEDVGGVIHCFSEDRAFAARALDLGFDLSFSGVVTFKNAQSVHDVAAWAPADRILVETDAPYLAPHPLRGKRCEPAYVAHTARAVAMLRGVQPDEIAQLTSENACRRFGPALAAAVGMVQNPS
ncbi:MAG: TatD family hydrolase [Polyangiaceae bacterium]|nr:TatD family hydrolase [Polyangiaceae bacterium]